MQYKTDLGDGFDGINLTGGNPAVQLDGGGNTFNIGALSAGLAIFDKNNSAYRMIIENGGNVGIGTFTPGSLLDVKGTVNLQSGHNEGIIIGAENNSTARNDNTVKVARVVCHSMILMTVISVYYIQVLHNMIIIFGMVVVLLQWMLPLNIFGIRRLM